jgi:hypothetical protein
MARLSPQACGMSALGQKQTCAAQLAMSVYPQNRTFAVLPMGQKRTSRALPTLIIYFPTLWGLAYAFATVWSLLGSLR